MRFAHFQLLKGAFVVEYVPWVLKGMTLVCFVLFFVCGDFLASWTAAAFSFPLSIG